jgi:tRNA1Val (adenine37-N6)-methyltransferase
MTVVLCRSQQLSAVLGLKTIRMFHLKRFTIHQDKATLKVGTDGVILGAWADVAGVKRVLDVGTGTGLLALMVAQRNGEANIDAVEIDDASAEQAAENVAASPWAERIRVHRMDVRKMHAAEPYDLIICNPPFYAGEMASPDARAGVARHSGELTFEELLDKAAMLLAPHGRFACILPLNREQEVLKIADHHGLRPQRRCLLNYLEHRPAKRVLLELARTPDHLREELLVVEHEPGQFTLQYRHLLKDFLLKF